MARNRDQSEKVARDIISLCEAWISGLTSHKDFQREYVALVRGRPPPEPTKFRTAFVAAVEIGSAIDLAIKDLAILERSETNCPTLLRAYLFARNVKSVDPVLHASFVLELKG